MIAINNVIMHKMHYISDFLNTSSLRYSTNNAYVNNVNAVSILINCTSDCSGLKILA